MSIRSTLLRCSIAAAMLALAPVSAPAQQVTKIRAVAQGIANFAVLLVAREKGIFKEQNLEGHLEFRLPGRARRRSGVRRER